MSAQGDGGPAFPVAEQRDADMNGIVEGHPGMSLRDWFAGQALTLCAMAVVGRTIKGESIPSHDDVAVDCYKFADAMLKARQHDPQ